MLHFFPTPYPDETLYSIISRYHRYSGNRHFSETTNDLFGKIIFIGRTNLPTYIGKGIFLKNLKNMGLSAEEILFNHTAYSYWVTFKRQDRRKQIFEALITDVEEKFFSNGVCQEVTEKYFKHCASCIKEDISNFGETYWYRTHQIPGVFTCSKHNELLIKTIQFIPNNQFIYPNQQGLFTDQFEEKINKSVFELFNTYTNEVSVLLNMKNKFNFNDITKQYKEILKQKGYSMGSVINKELVKKDILNYYNHSLKYFGVGGKDGTDSRWVNSILHKGDTNITQRHLLFIIFLCGSITNFINLIQYRENHRENHRVNFKSPFESGPWPCLNPACINYKKNVIKSFSLREDTKNNKLYGIFTCKCGFKYKRFEYTNKNNFDSVIFYGSIWKQRLAELISSGKDIRTIRKEIGASPITINHYKKKFKEGNLLNEEKEITIRAKEKSKLLFEKRNLWLGYLDQDDVYINKSDYRKLYKWLHLNDREWLQKHKKRIKVAPKINWEKRDIEFLIKLKDIINNWRLFETEKTIRKTKAYLFSLIGFKYRTTDHKDKLPLTENYLKKVVETTTEFRIRKIKFAIEKLDENNEKVAIENIIKVTKDSKPESRNLIKQLVEAYHSLDN